MHREGHVLYNKAVYQFQNYRRAQKQEGLLCNTCILVRMSSESSWFHKLCRQCGMRSRTSSGSGF